jgi:MinD superfamily P-loop ATPase
MKIAVASGKGGTGKTTVAVSLALSLAAESSGGPLEGPPLDGRPLYLDCDVEAPNAALFLRPEITEAREVGQLIPEVDVERCTACGRCAEVCQYHAIAVIGAQVLVFPELCHGCGSCTLTCPEGAIREVLDVMGTLERGLVRIPGGGGDLDFAQGTLDVGEAMAVPVIRQLKQWALPPRGAADRPVILDAPPGASCPVVETMQGADGVLLVTEPTPFGLHDLEMAVQVARDELKLPVAVVVNRDGVADFKGVDDYCEREGVPIVMRIPQDRAAAEAYADGQPLIAARPAYRAQFTALYQELARRWAREEVR